MSTIFPLRVIGTKYACDVKTCPKIRIGPKISCDTCQQSRKRRAVEKSMVYMMRCPHCKNKATKTAHGESYKCGSCNWSSDSGDKKNKSTNRQKWFKSIQTDKIRGWIKKAVGLGSSYKTTHSENTPYLRTRTRTINTPKGIFRVNQLRDVDASGGIKRGSSFRVYAHPREGKETLTEVAQGHGEGKNRGRKLYRRIEASKKSIRGIL